MRSVQVSERWLVGTIASYRVEYLSASGRGRTRTDVIGRMCSPTALEQFQYRICGVIDRNHIAGCVRISEEHAEMFQCSDDPCDVERTWHDGPRVANENGRTNDQQLITRYDSTNGNFCEHFGSRISDKMLCQWIWRFVFVDGA